MSVMFRCLHFLICQVHSEQQRPCSVWEVSGKLRMGAHSSASAHSRSPIDATCSAVLMDQAAQVPSLAPPGVVAVCLSPPTCTMGTVIVTMERGWTPLQGILGTGHGCVHMPPSFRDSASCLPSSDKDRTMLPSAAWRCCLSVSWRCVFGPQLDPDSSGAGTSFSFCVASAPASDLNHPVSDGGQGEAGRKEDPGMRRPKLPGAGRPLAGGQEAFRATRSTTGKANRIPADRCCRWHRCELLASCHRHPQQGRYVCPFCR